VDQEGGTGTKRGAGPWTGAAWVAGTSTGPLALSEMGWKEPGRCLSRCLPVAAAVPVGKYQTGHTNAGANIRACSLHQTKEGAPLRTNDHLSSY
jgi:hypothetical protein